MQFEMYYVRVQDSSRPYTLDLALRDRTPSMPARFTDYFTRRRIQGCRVPSTPERVVPYMSMCMTPDISATPLHSERESQYAGYLCKMKQAPCGGKLGSGAAGSLIPALKSGHSSMQRKSTSSVVIVQLIRFKEHWVH